MGEYQKWGLEINMSTTECMVMGENGDFILGKN
jgi:hypothetical protein